MSFHSEGSALLCVRTDFTGLSPLWMLLAFFSDRCWKLVVAEKGRRGEGCDSFHWAVGCVGDVSQEAKLGLRGIKNEVLGIFAKRHLP